LHQGRPAPAPVLREGIALQGVRYAFDAPADGGEPFVLGPIDLELRRGEMVFIVGDNGSGKTTLIKLLLGLYPPAEGQILLDGVPVTDQNREDYRELFSAIFSDYHLFDELIPRGPDQLRAAEEMMVRLEIAGKVRLADGTFSTTDVSTGQRKRLALV
ncbi:ATP-binding cassette domain-containing protein, partial [Corallococcus coralloides]|nr:ATP-binding cassette domain-containing protein [Corallococcus coralloides]